MPSFIDEYLLRLGATVDQSGMNRFQNALREAAAAVDRTSAGMGASFLKVQTEIVAGFAAIGSAAVGLVDHVAMADQEVRLFGLHMYMGKEQARSLKIAMDALGQPLENLFWDPELRGRTRQLAEDQRRMAPEGDYDAQMRKIRDVRFEFTRMEVELKYLGMHVVQDFMNALGMGPDRLLTTLRKVNEWAITHLPQISEKITRWFLPIWRDMKDVFLDTARAVGDVVMAVSDVIGLLTGDDRITRATGVFEKFGLAVQKVSHIFATFAETVDDLVDLLAHLVSAMVHLSKGDFSAAGADLRGAWADVNARTVGAAIMAGSAVLAPELLPEEAEAAGEGGAGAGVLARLWGRMLGAASKHPILAFGAGANLGGLVSGGRSSDALMAAIAAQESGALGMSARSSKGAIGTMQLMPDTAKWLGVNPYDPAQNAAGGRKYMDWLLARYHGNVAEALGAYNAGPGRMDAFLAGKASLPSETRDYIAKVLARAGQTGDVTVGSIVIHVAGTNATPEQIAHATRQSIEDMRGKQSQRDMAEYNQLSYAW